LRNLVEKTGYWPVVLGGETDLASHESAIVGLGSGGAHQILANARALDSDVWLTERLEVRLQGQPDLHEEWPADVQHDDSFSIPYDLGTAALRTTCFVGLVPAAASWQVPALLHFGNRGDCSTSAEHASVLARWERMYAAEVVGMTRTAVELSVGSPPGEPAEALDLAHEQFAYCPNIVLQGTLTIERLAATLLDGRVWFFAWD
jgi:hypothetical protein